MPWRDNLRPGSFRGVPFHTLAGELEGGRRLAVHLYPGRDRPWPEDLGRAARGYTLEVYVLGDDVRDRRDALLAALEQPGPGPLVHHWLGERQVSVARFRLVETSREGRIARFVLTLVEAGENREPAEQVDSRGAVNDRADQAAAAANADFADVFETDDQPGFVAESAATTARSWSAQAGTLLSRVPGVEELAELSSELETFDAAAATLVTTPVTLAGDVTDLTRRVGLAMQPDQARTGLTQLLTFGSDFLDPPQTTAARQAQATNQAAQVDLARRAAAIELARTAARADPVSRDDARSLREEVSDALDVEILAAADAGSDPVFAALTDLRAATVRDLTERGAALPELVILESRAVQPALALAWELYEDAARDAEIVARNGVRHPGFLPAGPLEVLAA